MTDNSLALQGSTCVKDASTRSFDLKSPLFDMSANAADKEQFKLPPVDPEEKDYKWYPMYVQYRQELKVQKELVKFGFRTFIPMEMVSQRRKGEDRVGLVPAVHNLIFVFSLRKRITWMKMFNEVGAKMQYMSSVNRLNGTSEVITVPKTQMANIMKAASVDDPDGLRSYIDTPLRKDPAIPGRRIVFVDGPFAGVEGVIQRVSKNRVMLIDLPNSKSIQIKISRAQDINYL